MKRGAENESTGTRRVTRRQFGALAASSIVTPFVARPTWASQVATPAAIPVASPISPLATPAASGPHLTVSPASVRLDEPFSVVISGLKVGQKVSITSHFTDALNDEWSATAYWTVLGSQLDLAMEAPSGGNFTVPDPMGLIWAATGGPEYVPPAPGMESVVVVATIDGARIGQSTVQRGLSLPDDQPRYVYNDQMVAYFYAPPSGAATPAPAVVVLHGSEGWPSYPTELVAAILASHGYATLALGYFGPTGHLPRTLENVPLEYFGTAIAWLKQQPSVRKDRIGVIGYSRGGELALLLGAYYPELTAVVSMSGSGYVVQAPGANPPAPAWTWRGRPIPYLVSNRVNTGAELARAEIPVERTNGPVLMVSGGGDKLWPSTWLSTAAWDRLQRLHHPWPDQFLRYPGAGHGILPPYVPQAPLVGREFGGDPLSNEIASVNSWQAVLHLLEERLRY